jgi:hypothetical protein
MTNRTWIGVGNNVASNPKDWSHGSNVVATVSAGGGPATINITGTDNLSLQVGSPGSNAGVPVNSTVNLAANSDWIGSFNAVAGVSLEAYQQSTSLI